MGSRKQTCRRGRVSHIHVTGPRGLSGSWVIIPDTPPSTFSFWLPPSHYPINGPGRNHSPISSFLPFSGLDPSISPTQTRQGPLSTLRLTLSSYGFQVTRSKETSQWLGKGWT